MDYNFAEFLKKSGNNCKTREDFLEQVDREIVLASGNNGDPQFYVDRKSYLKRLEGAKFAAVANQFRETDKYNDELGRLLDRLK